MADASTSSTTTSQTRSTSQRSPKAKRRERAARSTRTAVSNRGTSSPSLTPSSTSSGPLHRTRGASVQGTSSRHDDPGEHRGTHTSLRRAELRRDRRRRPRTGHGAHRANDPSLPPEPQEPRLRRPLGRQRHRQDLARAGLRATRSARVSLVVPVAPNWTTNEDLLGYQSPLDGSTATRRSAASCATQAPSGHGRAARTAHPAALPRDPRRDEPRPGRVLLRQVPLRRWNSARARARRTIELAPDDTVTLGPNLRFVGTVNIDETTHLFSDKVFDRAQLVELDDRPRRPRAAHRRAPYASTLLELWDAAPDVAPFAFRIVDEIGVYVAHAEQPRVSAGRKRSTNRSSRSCSQAQGRRPARRDGARAADRAHRRAFPLSHAKAQTMHEGFVQHGFSSYF